MCFKSNIKTIVFLSISRKSTHAFCICIGQILLSMRSALGLWLIDQWCHSIEENWFSQQIVVANSFYVRDGTECPLPLLCVLLRILSGLNLYSLIHSAESLWVHMYVPQAFCVCKVLFHWSHLPTLALITFLSSLLHKLWNLVKKEKEHEVEWVQSRDWKNITLGGVGEGK